MDEKTIHEISNWHENFDDRVYKIVETDAEAKELSESTYELDDIYMREFRHIGQRMRLLEEDLARAKRRSAQRFTYMTNLNIIRGYLNTKFRQFWGQLKQKEEKIDDMISFEMLKKYSNRASIYDDTGYKFAVYVLENPQMNILGVSNKTCMFYISLNEKMHPPILPHNIVVKAIQEIKKDAHEDSDLQRKYGITDEVLDEIVNFPASP